MGVVLQGLQAGLLNQPSAQVIDGSLKFDGTSNYLTRSFSAGNRRTWTWAAWVKRYKFGAANYGLFSYYPGSGNGGFIRFSDDDSGDTLRFYSDTNSRSIVSKEKFRDTGWYHIVIAVDTTQGTDTDRVKRYVNGVQQTTNASNTWPSASEELLFNQSGNHYIGRVQASAYGPVAMSNVYFIDGQALDASYFGYTDGLTNTWRPKKLEGVDLNGTTFTSKAIIHWTHTGGAVSAGVYNAAIGSVSTGGSYSGDTWTATNSAWVDTWDMGSADSFTLSSWSVGSYSDQTWYWSNDSSFASGVTGPNSGTIANGTYSTTVSGTKYRYLRVQNIPSATYSVVGNNSHTGKLGTNGFYLPMDNDDFHIDKSGNGNNWTKQNFSGTFNDPDVLKDSPSGAVSGGRAQTGITTTSSAPSNYATLNPLSATGGTFTRGNLRYTGPSANRRSNSTISVSTGKWYWEVTLAANPEGQGSSQAYHAFGFGLSTISGSTEPPISTTDALHLTDTGWYKNFSGSWTNASGVFTAGSVLSIAVDLDSNTFEFKHNNSSLVTGTIGGTAGRELTPIIISYSTNFGVMDCNFGQKPFKYAPPQGYLPLNSASATPETVITRPDHYVGVKLYTGNGGTQSINVGLKPDLVWIKNRDQNYSHMLMDSVRGDGNTKWICSDLTREQGVSSGNGDAVFTSDGFQLRVPSSTNTINGSGDDCVSWSWKAGGNKNTFNVDDVGYATAAAVNMSVGALTSVSYNQTQTWSSGGGSGLYSGSNWTGTFDGTPATTGSDIAQSAYVTNNGSSTLTFSTAISGVLKFKACQGSDSTSTGSSRPFVTLSNGIQIRVDAGNSSPGILSFGSVSNITSLSINGTSAQGMNLIFLELDGKLLVDSGITPPNAPSIANTGASVGTKQGFSIIKYTGTDATSNTFSHGLSQKPDFAIFKNLSQNGDDWIVYHTSLGATKRVKLNSTAAADSQSSQFNNTEPTSSLFTIGTYDNINQLNDDYISYIWHDVPGLQKFGSYEGNESTNGPFVELGFRPAILLVKNADEGSNDWKIYDGTRNPHNVVTQVLYPNAANDEDANTGVDFLSNGFKWRDSGSSQNGAETIIYAAWSEAPSFNLYGAQSNAR